MCELFLVIIYNNWIQLRILRLGRGNNKEILLKSEQLTSAVVIRWIKAEESFTDNSESPGLPAALVRRAI